MPRPRESTPDDDLEPDVAPAPDTDGEPAETPVAGVDLSGLPVAGLTRRRVAFLLAGFVAAWIVIVFARQAGEAAAATTRVEEMRMANAALAAEVSALDRELELIQRQAYIVQQARGYRMGKGGEVAFTLSADAPPLAADAPGSAAVRLGAEDAATTPLESWLALLFGPVR